MNIVLGSGNNRKSFEIATGRQMKELAKTNGVEHAKILGNLKALMRRQPAVRMTEAAYNRLKAKNASKRGLK